MLFSGVTMFLFVYFRYIPYPIWEYPPNTIFWNQQHGYPKFTDAVENAVFPYRVESGGSHKSLYVELFQDLKEWQNYCSGAYSGFKVSIMHQ